VLLGPLSWIWAGKRERKERKRSRDGKGKKRERKEKRKRYGKTADKSRDPGNSKAIGAH